MRLFTIIWPFLVVLTLLISPAIVISLRASETLDVPRILLSLSVALLVFTAPAGLCFRNVKLYFYLLTPLVVLTPVFLFSIYYFGLPPGFELIAFTLQTNPREAQEAIAPFLAYFIVFQLFFVRKECASATPLKSVNGYSYLRIRSCLVICRRLLLNSSFE